MLLTRETIINKLLDWKLNLISETDINSWANALYPSDEVEYNDWEENHSVTNEVLCYLDNLDMNLGTTDDIPQIILFLKTPLGEFESGYSQWNIYMKNIDIEKRQISLIKNPFYTAFCNKR